MNKFFFPTTLVAVLAIATVFAFVPVDYAQTTHLPTIGSNQITDGSITAADIGTGAVDTDELAADAVTSAKIAPNTIAVDDIGTGAVDTDELAADAVTSAKIAPNTIAVDDIGTGAVDTDELAALAVTAAKIAADTITPTQWSATLTLDETTTIGTGTAGLIIDGANGIQIDATNGLVINKILTGVGSPAGAVITAGSEETVTVTVTGADTTNDVAICSYNTNADFDAMIITSVVISAPSTVTVTTTNPTAASITTDSADVIRCFVYGVP